MSRIPINTLVAFVLLASMLDVATAQDFRIYTNIHDEGAAAAPVVARSLTIFHAGKAYDYMVEVGEVIIVDFDPAKRHFMILNLRRQIATTVHFDQVKHRLQVANQAADEAFSQLESDGESVHPQIVSLHKFQQSPTFDEQYLPDQQQLNLTSSQIRYKVKCADAQEPEFVEAYLRYADWISRLNYVLHPGMLLPEPRLRLNQALRAQAKIPTEVKLQVQLPQPISLRAVHQFKWELDPKERSYIGDWEDMPNRRTTRHVTFQEYQQEVLQTAFKERR